MQDRFNAQANRSMKDRRSERGGFRLKERRTGFDRRETYPVTGSLRDNPVLLLTILAATLAMSVLDLELTRLGIAAGVSVEANALMASLLAQDPMQALLFKLGVASAIGAATWVLRRHRPMLAVAAGGFALYLGIIGYHLMGLTVTGVL